MIARHFFSLKEKLDRQPLKEAGFLLDDSFSKFIVPKQGTYIKSYPVKNGRVYEQHSD